MKSNSPVLIAGSLLFLNDGQVILQRRDADIKVCPSLLNPFGGHAEEGEDPLATARRELAEETSLDVDELSFKELFTIDIPKSGLNPDDERVTVFRTEVKNLDFYVFEGQGAEVFKINSLSKRKDLTPLTKLIVERLLRMEANGIKYN